MDQTDSDTSEFKRIFQLEKKLQNELDYEKYNALGEVAKYLKSCSNHLVINTLFLKLAQSFKDLPAVLKVELKDVLKECVTKFAFSMNINEFLNIFAQSLDSIDSLSKCQVIEIIQIFGPFCVDRHDLFHKIFDIFINTKINYEKHVAMAGLKTLHQAHHNFAKTLLKNMHSYLHFGSGGSSFASGLTGNSTAGGSLGSAATGVPFITIGLGLGGSSSSNQSSDEQFKRIVELLPLNSRSMNMELLEIYIAILQKLLNEVLLYLQKKSQSIRKRRRVPIVKIILASLMDCANSFPILREFIFGIVYAGCKKCFEAKSDLGTVFESFLVMYLCKLGSSLEEKAFKQSLELLNSAIIPDEKQKIKLLYNAVVHFPTFMDHYKTTPSIKDRLKAITFENYQPQFLQNTDLYRAETLVDDFNFILRCFPADPKVAKPHQSSTETDTQQSAHSSDQPANGPGAKPAGNGFFAHPELGFGVPLGQGLVQTPQGLVPHSILVSGKIPVYNIPVSSLLPAIMLPTMPTLEELEPRLEPFFVFVNMFLFRRKYQLFIPIIQEDKFCDVLLQLLNRIHRYMPFAVLKTYCILLTFFSNIYSSFDKKVLQVLSDLPKECLTKLRHSEMRKLGIIFLTHNMPRSSTFFFYTPKRDSKKIKFFAYFDCCKRLAGLKTSRRGPNAALCQDQGMNAVFIDELHKMVLVFASLKEFKFSHEYLKLQSDIHNDLFAVFTHLAEVEQSSQHAAAAQEDDFYIKRSAEGTERRNSRASPHMSIGNLDAEQEEVDRLAQEPLVEENPEKQDSAPLLTARDRFERLQSRTLLLVHFAEHYLEDDSLSRSALLAFAKFLSLVMRFLESFELADAATLRKTKQHLQDFLNQKGTGLFSSDLYYYFKIRKVIGILEGGIEKAPVSEVKMSILKYLSEIDYLMLPRSVFISNKTPKLHANQGLLWQFRDKHKVSSLQEHVVECEIEVQNLPRGSQTADSGKNAALSSSSVISGGPSAGWVVEAEITCTETVFNQVRFTKKAIKTTNNLLSFSFLLHFDTACPYRLSMCVKLLNRAGFQIDQLTLEDHLDVV